MAINKEIEAGAKMIAEDLRLPGGGLKTSNEQTAIRDGRRLLFQLEQRAEQGLSPKSKFFTTIIDEYIIYRKRDHEHGETSAGMLRQIIRVSKFWREYAGQLPVEALDDNVMREFIPWRRDYYRLRFSELWRDELWPSFTNISNAGPSPLKDTGIF